MKIAYLILAHDDPQKLKRLIMSLQTRNAYFFIHIDKKVELSPFQSYCSEMKNVRFIKNRVKVNWGGYSMCIAERELIRDSLSDSVKYDRFILLSGLDYPIWPNSKIETDFINNPKKEYMKAYNLSIIKTPRKIPQRVKTYHFRDILLPNKTLNRLVIGALMRIMNVLPIKKDVYIKDGKMKYSVWGGSQWWILTRDCVKYILHEMDVNKKLCNYFRTSLAPDELFLQTIVFNSPFKANALFLDEDGVYPGLEKTTYTHYIEYKGNQKVFTDKDFSNLVNSGKMFCRKTRSGVSDKLMDMLDAYRNEKTDC